MQRMFQCIGHRLHRRTALLLLSLAIALLAVHCVLGWSGADAYTVVLLKSFDTDLDLQEQFYNAPAGTAFTLARDGYRILDSAIRLPVRRRGGNATDRKHSVLTGSERGPAYLLNPSLSTGATYQNAGRGSAALSYHGRFSDEWVVWTKEDAAHGGGEPLLLHCRLPLPHNRTAQRLRQERYITQHAAAFSARLQAWWHASPAIAEPGLRCLYGDGEKTQTAVERYYELCPSRGMHRVQHHLLAERLRGSPEEVPVVIDGVERAAPTVMDFMKQMRSSLAARNTVLRDPRYKAVFEEVGRFHPRYSVPRWNQEYLVWESVYPSTQPCATHFTTIASLSATSRVRANATRTQRTKVHPEDPYWKTVVRFRCPPERQADGRDDLTVWSVTEVRQLCEYNVDLFSSLVCGWEQELDSFNVNPVPCVALD